MRTVRVAVPRKGRPLEGVLERLASLTGAEETADDIISTLRFEKAITKDNQRAEQNVYERLSDYSDLTSPTEPEFTLFRDDRDGMPRRIVFDSVTIPTETVNVQLVGREEPFRALRTHEFALGFDSADLVLEEVVQLRNDPIAALSDINDRIDPLDTDVRVVSGLGDTVHHTLLGRPDVLDSHNGRLDREFVRDYEGEFCISPRYERLVEAVLGTGTLDGIEFTYPADGVEEEAAIADTGLGVYLTVTGSTARDNGLVLGEQLFPSETVLLANESEVGDEAALVRDLLAGDATAPTQ
jgi:hypothetical protein